MPITGGDGCLGPVVLGRRGWRWCVYRPGQNHDDYSPPMCCYCHGRPSVVWEREPRAGPHSTETPSERSDQPWREKFIWTPNETTDQMKTHRHLTQHYCCQSIKLTSGVRLNLCVFIEIKLKWVQMNVNMLILVKYFISRISVIMCLNKIMCEWEMDLLLSWIYSLMLFCLHGFMIR